MVAKIHKILTMLSASENKSNNYQDAKETIAERGLLFRAACEADALMGTGGLLNCC